MAAGVDFVPLEERLPGDLAAWEAAALQFAVGVHDALVRRDATAREAFSALCGNRYCSACGYRCGVPGGAEYVVCMSEEECVPMAGPGVTPLIGFQPRGDRSASFRNIKRLAFSFDAGEIGGLFVSHLNTNIGTYSSSFYKLGTVDLSGVRGVTAINNRFMEGCRRLRSFDFAPFKCVRSIGSYCFASCYALSDVSLRGLENLVSVGSCFAIFCSSITALNLSPLRSLEGIGDHFLANTRLATLDLEPLHAIKHIPDKFLRSSERLESLVFSPLTNAETIGSAFLLWCPRLRHVSLCGLENVRTLGDSFLRGCKSLESLDLSPLQNVESIGSDAFSECVKLRHIDFSHLRNVRDINLHGFLRDCDALSDESRASAEAFKEECRRRANRSVEQ